MRSRPILIFGDLLAISVVTVIGFATHGEANVSFLPRILSTFVPLVVSWLLLAPWFGLFTMEVASDLRQIWRPTLAMSFAAPLAAVMRGLILNAPVLPLFAVVLGGTSAFGISVWRLLWSRIDRLRIP